MLYGQLLEQIIEGALQPGEKLPTEAAICAAFGVSRPVVREALLRLQDDGLVEARRGSGTYLLRAPSAQVTRFLDPGDFAAYMRSLEVRMALEPVAARLAAKRRTSADIQKIQLAARDLEDAVADGRGNVEPDIAFHRAIHAATRNDLFERQFESLRAELSGWMTASLGLTSLGSAERKRAVVDEHRHIAEAIERGDAEAAEICMRYHLLRANERMLNRVNRPG